MEKKPARNGIPQERIELYDSIISSQSDVERKGAAMPYTSCNGHMFSFLSPTGSLFIRLSEKDKEHFIKKHKPPVAKQHGKILMEYVEVPEKLFKDQAEVKKYFALSYQYVKTLNPK